MVVPLAMGWHHLLSENWPVDTALIDAHLPDTLEPDADDGPTLNVTASPSETVVSNNE